MRGKKGQITWFVIIGIVILLGVGTVIYIRQTTERGITEEVPAGREVMYEGEQEIRNFVDSCLKPIVLQGMEIQRLQAGYIEIPSGRDVLIIKDKEENEQVKLTDSSKNVFIDKQGEGNYAPFWITQYGIAIPSKEFMESELAYYITKELDKCVGDFKQFTDMGFKIEKEAITTNVSFAKSTWVKVNLPLTVTIHELTYQISDFNIEISINMELIYNIGSDLAFYQDLYAYLESFTLDLIEKYSWRGGTKEQPHYLPPKRFTDAGFDCSQTTWTLDEVKNGLKNNYNQNLKYLKVAGTNFEREIRSDPVEQGVLDGYIQNFFAEQYPSIKIEYVYEPDWFFNLDILPKAGNTIKPDRTTAVGIPLLPRLCTFKYRFNYFYDFPVLLKVTDESSAKIDIASNTFKKEGGYELQIPLWVFVCGNKKRECTGKAETYDITSTIEETAFCEESQKLSGDITINVKEGAAPVKDVDVYYVGTNSLQNCFMGRTNDDGTLTTKFPFCSGCSIELYKEDYPVKKQRFDILDYENKEIILNLAPFAELNVNAKLIKIPTFARSWYETEGFTNADKMIELYEEYRGIQSTLSPNLNELRNNKALMAVLKGEEDLNPANEDMVMITGTGLNPIYYIYPDPENAKLKLGPGTYNMNLVTMGNVYISNETMPSASIIDGAYPLSPEMSYTWEIGDLTGKSTVTFYSLVEHTSAELNPGEWSMLLDNIMQNGTMKTYNIEIKKEEYLPYILPEIN